MSIYIPAAAKYIPVLLYEGENSNDLYTGLY